eukprot:TRINITY_DN11197_c0_g1_i1.p1 TRINITY_DN11197_c0_g1~~TRINITY_DN11197_c0_g1_i1.p1  ORF type:complete len:556 (-),score=65.82 TRINITY_DN11197_c0_g1_i1:1492-3132(-)
MKRERLNGILPTGLQILGPVTKEFEDILSIEALNFLVQIHRRFDDRRLELLQARHDVQRNINAGIFPDFLETTRHIREGNWRVNPVREDLQYRRVEITGPVDRKMIINALNSGAEAYMADFEDSHAPSWRNTLEGQINLKDAIRRTISYTHPSTSKVYKLGQKVATLIVRPRGLHLDEASVIIDGKAISGALFDFGLFIFHNASYLLSKDSGPYFYLPKLEHHLEAKLWNDVFIFAQNYLRIPRGSIKATVLIETILAAFQMDEILYQLREHSSGLNCGRWDYIFSFIKKFQNHPEFVLPDRDQIGMDVHFMSAYVKLLIKTCHRRGAHAMGGMAAQIPVRGNPELNAKALGKVRTDKLREAEAGHDGTWVAHPGLIKVAQEAFDQFMKGKNQIESGKGLNVNVAASDLLAVPKGTRTAAGVATNVRVCILYIEPWLREIGCVPIDNKMEDAATAEISRCQIWQWIRHAARLDDGTVVTKEYVLNVIQETEKELTAAYAKIPGNKLYDATRITEELMLSSTLMDFLTYLTYPRIVTVYRSSNVARL